MPSHVIYVSISEVIDWGPMLRRMKLLKCTKLPSLFVYLEGKLGLLSESGARRGGLV